MQGQDWFISGDGKHQICKSARDWDLLRDNYRLYRFLTEVEDVLNQVEDESTFLPQLRMLVRRLIINSYWVQSQVLEPDPKTGTSVLLLYDELGFPLTVQTVTFAPGTTSNIHNHGTWGIVAILKGQEKNTFWRRNPTDEFPDKIEKVGELNLQPGDLISFTPETIHQVQAVGNEPTVTFNIYGETDPKERFEFYVTNHIAKKF
ncbi:MAG: cupin [Sphaerospermopsis kisseleviana]|jgi:predicted metal-dependent enzyme (double-stranded beta helix superfamily)|uniref:Cupin region n=2 Tax=Sphaerospermopsis TaxID=752201 RepID=A0A480A0P8_9CYAN|nr:MULTISPECIES: cupin [Sphaerospermopsis]BAZ80646.1 cupin domain-containing protein [Sphaerospermopsis kisseleviana NIES-73]MBD2131511.1 cupin [Sphaerospermopsis sp. FACHB-1094]MBD2146256.1 cupin [Sphaerospermopsis sp. FACHB-1194]MDB9441776.1 cupin [Sphaerospermopsis kisseleviana CS-549]GCL38570.1 cupin region [Sphaerospermopsis reniformis]